MGQPPSPREAASGTVFVPPRELQVQRSCAGVWAMLEGIPPDRVPLKALSAALDSMVKLGKEAGQDMAPADLAAVRQLLALALKRLGGMDAWALVAFIRFAAAFEAQAPLAPANLSDWQAAVGRPVVARHLTAQGLANALLSLGTLADASTALAAAVDRRLAKKLLRRGAQVVGGSGGWAMGDGTNSKKAAQDVSNALYGAALLGLQPSAEEADALFDGVGRHVERMGGKDLTQASWLAQEGWGRGRRLGSWYAAYLLQAD